MDNFKNKDQNLVILLFCVLAIAFEVLVFPTILNHPYMICLLLTTTGIGVFNLIKYIEKK